MSAKSREKVKVINTGCRIRENKIFTKFPDATDK